MYLVPRKKVNNQNFSSLERNETFLEHKIHYDMVFCTFLSQNLQLDEDITKSIVQQYV